MEKVREPMHIPITLHFPLERYLPRHSVLWADLKTDGP